MIQKGQFLQNLCFYLIKNIRLISWFILRVPYLLTDVVRVIVVVILFLIWTVVGFVIWIPLIIIVIIFLSLSLVIFVYKSYSFTDTCQQFFRLFVVYFYILGFKHITEVITRNQIVTNILTVIVLCSLYPLAVLCIFLIWAIVGLLIWIPLLVIMMCFFTLALLSASLIKTDISLARKSLYFARDFYKIGFIQVTEITDIRYSSTK